MTASATSEHASPPRAGSLANIGDTMTDLRNLLMALHRRRWWIILPVIVSMMLAAACLIIASPKYTASAQLLVKGDSGPVVNLDSEGPLVLEDDALVLDEIRVLQSRELAQRVVETLQLARDPEFNEELAEPGVVRVILSRAAAGVRALLPWRDDAPMPDAVAEVIRQEKIVSTFLKKLSVERIDKSRVIHLSFTSESPITAKNVTNTLAAEYLAWRTNKSFEHARTAGAWLEERAQKLRDRVEHAEKAVQEYRQRHGLLEGERVTLIAEQISRLNAAHVDASIERKKAQADLAQVRRLLGPNADVSSASQVMSSDVYKVLRQEAASLEQQEAELGRELGPMHPQLQQLRARKERLQQDIAEEVRKVVRSLENQAAAASAREEALNRDLRALKEQLAATNFRSAELAALEREAEASRMLLAKVMTGSMEKAAEQDPGAQAAGADILSLAATPIEPSHPQTLLVLFLTLVASSLLGVLLALTVDMMDVTYRTAEQVERGTRAPLLAYIPALRRSESGGDVATFGLRHPSSPFAEAIRTVLVRLLMTGSSPQAKVVALVSSEPKEGKSTLALAIARLESRAGRRVLLIDADIRRSRIAQFLGVRKGPGLLDILSGTISLQQGIQIERQSGLHVVVSGDYRQHMNYSDYLVSDASRLRFMLDSLRDQYDVIFIDTPPMLALVDAQILSSVVDTSLVIVAWGRTPKRTVDATLNIIRSARAHIGGIIFNLVDRRKIGGYHAYEAGYFDRRYGKYYNFSTAAAGGASVAAARSEAAWTDAAPTDPRLAGAPGSGDPVAAGAAAATLAAGRGRAAPGRRAPVLAGVLARAGRSALLLPQAAAALGRHAARLAGAGVRNLAAALAGLRASLPLRPHSGSRAATLRAGRTGYARALPSVLMPVIVTFVATLLIANYALYGSWSSDEASDTAGSAPQHARQAPAAAPAQPAPPAIPADAVALPEPAAKPEMPATAETPSDAAAALPRPVPRPVNRSEPRKLAGRST